MRIGVWNLECVKFKERNVARLDFLRERDADIWVLTETHDEIDLSSTHPYTVRSRSRVKSRNDMHWVSIWSKFPLLEHIKCDDVRAAIALLQTPIGSLLLFGTVWPWSSDQGEHPVDGAWTGWARQPPVIVQQKAKWDQLKASLPGAVLCVAGDLNMGSGIRIEG